MIDLAQQKLCFKKKPVKGTALTEYATVCSLLLAVTIAILALTGEGIRDRFTSLIEPMKETHQSEQLAFSNQTSQWDSLSRLNAKENESNQTRLPTAFLEPNTETIQQTFSPFQKQTLKVGLANGTHLTLQVADDEQVYEVLGPNVVMQSRLSMLYQIADQMASQGASPAEISEIRDFARKSYELSQYRRVLDDFWSQKMMEKKQQFSQGIWWREMRNNKESFQVGTKKFRLQDLENRFFTRLDASQLMQKKALLTCGAQATLACLKRYDQKIQPNPHFSLDNKLALRQIVMEKMLSESKTPEIQGLVSHMANDVWTLSDKRYTDWKLNEGSAASASMPILHRTEQLCSIARSKECLLVER